MPPAPEKVPRVSVVVAGLNHRTVPLEVLEAAAVPAESLAKALGDLTGRPHLDEVVVLSTCMRTEIYASCERFHGALGDIRDFLCLWTGHPPEDLADGLYEFYDAVAARHLLRVAAGLDSTVLGEGEILRQVRAAADGARAHGSSGPVLAMLVRHAVEAGKRVRTETGIARGTTSLSHAAVAVAALGAQASCPGASAFAGRACLVVGAGEMGAALVGLLTPAAVRVANRSAERAARLAVPVVPWSDLARAVDDSDVVFCATAAPHPLLDAATVGPREHRPLVVVDLGVPRNVDPAVGELPGVTRYDLGDIKVHAEAAMAGRRAEIPRAEAILDEELRRWQDAVAQRAVAAPIVAALRARAEAIRAAEVGRLGLDPAQRRAVDTATRRLVNKLLHDPSVALNTSAGGPRGERLAAALVELWGLDV